MLLFVMLVLFLLSSIGFKITENEILGVISVILIGVICGCAECLL